MFDSENIESHGLSRPTKSERKSRKERAQRKTIVQKPNATIMDLTNMPHFQETFLEQNPFEAESPFEKLVQN